MSPTELRPAGHLARRPWRVFTLLLLVLILPVIGLTVYAVFFFRF